MPPRLPSLLAVLILAGLASAQGAFLPTASIPCDLASGVIRNPTAATASVWSEPLPLPGASSFRLRFGLVELQDPGDAVVVTGVLDGQVQRLNLEAIQRWEGMTGWFNGSAAIVALELAPGSSGSVQVVSAEAFVGGPAFPEAVCDTDTRSPGGSNRIFRLLVPVNGGVRICTGFLVSDRSSYVTAGRCYRGTPVPNSTAEFNVPLSQPLGNAPGSGSINHPPIERQFPGDPTTVLSQDEGAGEDWAVGRLHPNNLGQSADGLFGHFQIPPVVGIIATDVTIAGYGRANITQSQFNHTLRSDSGFVGWAAISGAAANNSIGYTIDTDTGNQGSPLVDVNLGFPLGIHVHDDCTSFNGFNEATPIYNAQLLAALATTNGCAAIHFLDDLSSTVPCTPTVYDCDTEGGRWNVVAVSSPGDWSIRRETLESASAGLCNFLLANGTLGDVPPISGEIRRASGTATARAQFVTAMTIPVGQTVITSWSPTRVVRAFEFAAPGPFPPSLTINVSGDPSLRWQLYAPDSLLGSGWIRRGSSNLVASGAVGGTPIAGVPNAANGTWCLVVFRDGGPAVPAPTTLAVTVAIAPTGFATLTPNVPAAIAAGATTFSLSPAAGAWNAVALAAADDYTLSLGSGTSTSSLANATEFVVANGQAGTVAPTSGIASSAAGAGPATIEHLTVAGPASAAGTVVSSIVPAGHALRLLPVSMSGIGSVLEINVTGDPSLRWHLFDGTAGAARWRGLGESLGSGPVGGPREFVNVPSGSHALVITRNGGLAPADLPFTVRLGAISTHLTLPGPGTAVFGLTQAAYGFTCTPPVGRWTAVAVGSSIFSSHALFIGSASAPAPPGTNAYVVANGRLGPVAPVDGILTRSSSANLIPGAIYQGSASTVTVGTPGTMNLTSTTSVHLFEFQVSTAATYDLTVSGTGVADWALFRPGAAGVWRSKAQGELLSAGGTVRTGITLQPGPHAIAVTFGAGATVGATFTCSVALNSNLPPELSSVTPTSAIGGSSNATIIITGSGILSGCTAEWDGTINVGVLNTAGIVLTGVPASVLAVPGPHTLRLVNPPPGGGPSAAFTFTVRPPRVASVSPPAVAVFTPGTAPVQLTVSGTDFLPGAVVHAGERVLPTTFVSSGQLRAQIDGSVAELNVVGGVGLTVENGHRAQSNTIAVLVGPGGSNRGTNVRYPLEPLPGEGYVGRLEGGPPGGLFTFIADFGNPAPVTSWPSAAVNLVLGIGSPSMMALVDGFGLLGPAFPGAVYALDSNGTSPGGTYSIPGFIWPQAPLNLRLSLQTINLDPSQPLGFGLGWTRIEDL